MSYSDLLSLWLVVTNIEHKNHVVLNKTIGKLLSVALCAH